MSDAKATIIASVITGVFTLICAVIALAPQIITLQRENSALTEENDALQTQLESNAETEGNVSSLEKRISDLETANAQLRQEKSQVEERYTTVQANYEAALTEIEEKNAEISALKQQLNDPSTPPTVPVEPNATEGTLPYLVNELSTIYDGSDSSQSFTVIDGQHTVGVFLATERDHYIERIAYALWNPASKYKTMSFTVCSIGENSGNAKMTVEVDSEVMSTYDLKWEDPPRTFPIAIKDATKVKITLSKVKDDIYYGVYNIQFS